MFRKQLALDNRKKTKKTQQKNKSSTKILIEKSMVPCGTRKTSRFFVVVFTFVLVLTKK